MNAWSALAASAGPAYPSALAAMAQALLAGIALASAAAAGRRGAGVLAGIALLEGLRLLAAALGAPAWSHGAAAGLALVLCAVLAGRQGRPGVRLAAALAATYLAGMAALMPGGIAAAVAALADACRAALLLAAALRPGAPATRGHRPPDSGEQADDVDQLRERLEAHRQAVALLSHELRGPLATLAAAAQSLEFALAGSGEETDARLARMRRSVARVHELAEQFMQRERLAQRMLRPQHEVVDLAALARDIVDALQPDAAHPLQVTPTASAVGWCDPALCAEVLRNLVHNAIKYSPADQPVTIDAGSTPDGNVWVSVTDHGPGIAADDLEQVFQPSYRAAAHRETRGTGHGLYLAQRMCLRQGGSLAVDSAVGRGARFTMRMAAAGAQAANT